MTVRERFSESSDWSIETTPVQVTPELFQTVASRAAITRLVNQIFDTYAKISLEKISM